MSSLAIVIPAYKSTFFSKTLKSLALQTNKNFNVYIGDDCSPDRLEEICEKYKIQLNINYHRFENNIGAKHLVQQWRRCVSLSKNEKWIWLFSDDDIADNNCVETFYKTVEADNNRFDVYRFNTRMIDKDDAVIEQTPESPFIESSFDMAMELLQFNRGNSIVDHIFSRNVYDKCNGFVYTDYAQGADWATSILFSTEKGICTMPNAKINWRLSSDNISGKASFKNEMIKGHFQFCNWLIKHFAYLKQSNADDYRKLKKSVDKNLQRVIHSHYKGLYFFMYKEVYQYYAFNNNIIKSVLLTLRLYSIIKLPKYLAVK